MAAASAKKKAGVRAGRLRLAGAGGSKYGNTVCWWPAPGRSFVRGSGWADDGLTGLGGAAPTRKARSRKRPRRLYSSRWAGGERKGGGKAFWLTLAHDMMIRRPEELVRCEIAKGEWESREPREGVGPTGRAFLALDGSDGFECVGAASIGVQRTDCTNVWTRDGDFIVFYSCDVGVVGNGIQPLSRWLNASGRKGNLAGEPNARPGPSGQVHGRGTGARTKTRATPLQLWTVGRSNEAYPYPSKSIAVKDGTMEATTDPRATFESGSGKERWARIDAAYAGEQVIIDASDAHPFLTSLNHTSFYVVLPVATFPWPGVWG